MQFYRPAIPSPPPFASLDVLDRFLTMGFSYRLPDTEEPRRKIKAPAKSARKKLPRRTHMTERESRVFRKDIRSLLDISPAHETGSSSKDTSPSLKTKISRTIWRKLSKNQKAILFGIFAHEKHGSDDCFRRAYSFSVNIEQRRLIGVKDIVSTLLARLVKALERRGITDTPLLIGLHSDRAGSHEIHFHGAGVLSPNEIKGFLEALAAVAGTWRPDGRPERQIHFEPRYGFTTWEKYIVDESAPTRRHLLDDLKCESGRTTAMTRPAIRATREFLEVVLGFTRDELE